MSDFSDGGAYSTFDEWNHPRVASLRSSRLSNRIDEASTLVNTVTSKGSGSLGSWLRRNVRLRSSEYEYAISVRAAGRIRCSNVMFVSCASYTASPPGV